MMMKVPEPQPEMARKSLLQRWLPLLILIAGFALFFILDLQRFVSLETLRENREALATWVEANGIWAPLAYIIVYALMVAFSVPGALVATLTGGFLFGTWAGGAYTIVGATTGATIVFLAARTALGDTLRRKAGPNIRKMEQGFRENAFSYLLILRLIPLFPFFLVNLAPAFLGVPLRTYMAATFIGIMPGTFVFASVGNGLGALFEQGREPDVGIIFEPQILGPILGLAVLALLPVIYRKWAARKPSLTA